MKVVNCKITGMGIEPGEVTSRKPGIKLYVTTHKNCAVDDGEFHVLVNLEHAAWIQYFTDSKNYEHVVGSYIRLAVDKKNKIQAIGDILEDRFIPVNDFLNEENKRDEFCLEKIIEMENKSK